jgi:hypothetical protein
MEQTTIKAVEMTRQIRDAYADELRGKSHTEIIAFYHQKAQDFHSSLNLPVQARSQMRGNPPSKELL